MSAGRVVGIWIVLAVFIGGCHGPTQDDRENRKAVDAVLTAITIKNARLLEDAAGRVKARRDAGAITAEQYQGIVAFVEKARKRDWAAAETEGYEFRKKHPFIKDGQ